TFVIGDDDKDERARRHGMGVSHAAFPSAEEAMVCSSIILSSRTLTAPRGSDTPLSRRETVAWSTPSAAASCCWLQPRFLRSALIWSGVMTGIYAQRILSCQCP